MRFMVMIKANSDTENGVMPNEKLLADMGKYNEDLVKAGIMQAGEGLHPSSKGVRVRFDGDQRTVENGPFPLNEVYCGFWLWKGEVQRRSHRVAEEVSEPDRRPSDHRTPAGLRGRRLRRGTHARAAPAGRALAPADRKAAESVVR